MTFSAGSLTVPSPDPGMYTGNLYLPDCEDANRFGLITVGIGAAVLAGSAIVWWRQRAAPNRSDGLR